MAGGDDHEGGEHLSGKGEGETGRGREWDRETVRDGVRDGNGKADKVNIEVQWREHALSTGFGKLQMPKKLQLPVLTNTVKLEVGDRLYRLKPPKKEKKKENEKEDEKEGGKEQQKMDE